MKSIMQWFTNPPTDGPTSTIYLRLMAGGVFLWEGILKFVYTNQGIGRFTKLGMPVPHFTANFVACFEIVGGLLLLSGLIGRITTLSIFGVLICLFFAIGAGAVALVGGEQRRSV